MRWLTERCFNIGHASSFASIGRVDLVFIHQIRNIILSLYVSKCFSFYVFLCSNNRCLGQTFNKNKLSKQNERKKPDGTRRHATLRKENTPKESFRKLKMSDTISSILWDTYFWISFQFEGRFNTLQFREVWERKEQYFLSTELSCMQCCIVNVIYTCNVPNIIH